MFPDCSVRSMLANNNGRIRLLEAHDPDSIEVVRRVSSKDGQSFHGVWMSGLTQSTYLGLPDTELISPLERSHSMTTLDNAFTFPQKRPLCAAFDADSGGKPWEVPVLLSSLAAKGVSMVITEDKWVAKPGSKVNSLSDSSGSQALAKIHDFAKVVQRFKAHSRNMLITARIESFTVRKPQSNEVDERNSVQQTLDDALERAHAYCRAGADAIMIHSKSKNPSEVLSFMQRFKLKDPHTILVVVPTTYAETTEEVLYNAGANVIIYANHLMRAKIRAIDQFEIRPDASVQVSSEVVAACLKARNYGCMLRALQERDLGVSTKKYAYAAQSCARENMSAVARILLDGQTAGAADERLITVKDLLKINAQQVCAAEPFMIMPPLALKDDSSLEGWQPVARL
ncbi:MAG: hypothetical protein ASARMPREDX12_007688 [Alectoria sarmentosa]|nr:MAG: hypothetical protein ASARMPREDX12_007688 [Alectoria sarmentosa]